MGLKTGTLQEASASPQENEGVRNLWKQYIEHHSGARPYIPCAPLRICTRERRAEAKVKRERAQSETDGKREKQMGVI